MIRIFLPLFLCISSAIFSQVTVSNQLEAGKINIKTNFDQVVYFDIRFNDSISNKSIFISNTKTGPLHEEANLPSSILLVFMNEQTGETVYSLKLLERGVSTGFKFRKIESNPFESILNLETGNNNDYNDVVIKVWAIKRAKQFGALSFLIKDQPEKIAFIPMMFKEDLSFEYCNIKTNREPTSGFDNGIVWVGDSSDVEHIKYTPSQLSIKIKNRESKYYCIDIMKDSAYELSSDYEIIMDNDFVSPRCFFPITITHRKLLENTMFYFHINGFPAAGYTPSLYQLDECSFNRKIIIKCKSLPNNELYIDGTNLIIVKAKSIHTNLRIPTSVRTSAMFLNHSY